jgi:putative endonuclease
MSSTLTNNEDLWCLYMIRTAKGHLYTGIAKDVEKRFNLHKTGKGARYLRGKGPLELVYQAKAGNHSEALKLERCIKKFTKIEKEALCQNKSTCKKST